MSIFSGTDWPPLASQGRNLTYSAVVQWELLLWWSSEKLLFQLALISFPGKLDVISVFVYLTLFIF